MGMQISRGVHTEVSAEGTVCAVAAGPGASLSGLGRAKGQQGGGGAFDVRPRAYAPERAAEILGVERDGVHQGQERDSHSASLCGPTEELRRSAFLRTRLLGIDGRQERGGGASIHPGAGEGRPTPRTTGDDGALSASR